MWLAALLLYPILRWQWNWHYLVWPAYLGNYVHLISLYREHWFIYRLVADPEAPAFLGWHVKLQISHFWSLCVEEQFYLVWPMLVYAIQKRETLIKLCAIVFTLMPFARWMAVTRLLPPEAEGKGILYALTPSRIDALLLGALLALCLRGPERQWLSQWRHTLLFGAAASYSAAYLLLGLVWRRAFVVTDTWVNIWGLTLVDLLAAAVLLEALHAESLIARLLRARWLRFAGTISYGLYVFHELLHGFFASVASRLAPGYSMLATTIVGFLASTALAWVSYRFYELPFLRLKTRFTHQVHRAPQV